MKNRFAYLLLLPLVLMLLIGFGQKSDVTSQSETQAISGKITQNLQSYFAGDTITLLGTIINKEASTIHGYLQLSSSYGTIVLSEKTTNGKMAFKVPAFLSIKSGWVHWSFISNTKKLDSGSFEVLPNPNFKKVAETYLGPPSIVAGGNDYAMIVATPTDIYDNLLPDNTKVTILEQSGAKTSTYESTLKNRIAWKRIFSPEKKGRLFTSVLLENSASREMNIDVFANQAESIDVTFEQSHPFADGNQILNLITAPITDRYNNVVTDGTLVQFIGTDSNQEFFNTSATTINGIATAKFLHPDAPTTWKIKAEIPGITSANEISIKFKSILNSYEILFSETNRTINVGPLKSYLGQLIPDGARVTLSMEGTTTVMEETSKDGFATFNISEDFYPAGTYNLKITALGISQSITKDLD